MRPWKWPAPAGKTVFAVAIAGLVAGCLPLSTRLRLDRQREHAHTPAEARAGAPGEAHAVAAAAAPIVDCDDVKIRAYNRQICCANVKDVLAPATLEELVATVKRTAPTPLRVVGNSHTSNEQICTDGYGLSLANFNQIHGLRRHDGVEYVEVDAGVRLSDLNRWLYERGRSIGFVTPGFRGVTIGGGIATGAHGSSMLHPSVMSSLVEYVQIVDGKGEVREYKRPHARLEAAPLVARVGTLASATPRATMPAAAPGAAVAAALESGGGGDDSDVAGERFRALAASVGMLGVVTKIGLRTEARFNLDVKVDFDDGNALFAQGVEKLVGDCDWGQLVYLPRADRIMRVCGKRTLAEPMAQASNSLLAPHVDFSTDIGAFKELMEDTVANGAYLCLIESERYSQLKSYPPFTRDCGCKTKYDKHVIGAGDLMMSSELTPYHDQLPEIDYEIAIPLSEAPAALKRFRDYVRDQHLCMPLIGAFLRFSPVDDTTLVAHSVTDDAAFKGQKVMFLEFVVYVLHQGETEKERAQQEKHYYKLYRDLGLQMVQYHHGRPHWGKNQIPLFQLHKEVDSQYAARLRKFHCWVRELDPDNRFANEFSRTVDLTPPRASDASNSSTATSGAECSRALRVQ
jgi:FAD binding domain/D-arabinono-1,4-lactone oxidase